MSRERSGTVVWSLGDRQGSVVDLVNQDGTVLNHFVYDGFGTRTGSTTAEFKFGYTGRELDSETGLYYYRARYYDSKVGRFISEDPIGFSAGDTNLYRYVGNNSTNYTDPTGTLISGWAEDLLLGADQLAAGFANVVSFGLTNKIRSTNKLAVENQEGWLYNLGTGLGLAASLALNPAGAGANWARGAASVYQNFGTAYGILDTANKVRLGTASAWDLLNFAPAVGFAARNGRKIGGAILKAGDTGVEAVGWGLDKIWGNNRQPQLVVAGSRAASATKRVDDVISNQFAILTGEEKFINIIGGERSLVTRNIDVNTVDALFKDGSSNAVMEFFRNLRARLIRDNITPDNPKQFQSQYSLIDVNTTKMKANFVMRSGAGKSVDYPLLTTNYNYVYAKSGPYTFDAFKVMNRAKDPERVSLEALAALHTKPTLHTKSDTGIIRVASELMWCDRCVDAGDDFEKLFDYQIQLQRISTDILQRPRYNGK